MKNKAEIIQESLEKNPDIEIVHTKKYNKLIYGEEITQFDSGCCEFIYHWVAPKKETITLVDKLNDFMIGLIPAGLVAEEIHNFFMATDDILTQGCLDFYENIIESKIIIQKYDSALDKNLFNIGGFVDGKKKTIEETTQYLRRNIKIFPFPSQKYARKFVDKNGNFREPECFKEHHISLMKI